MTMKTQIILFAWLCSGLNLLAQPAQLTREAYRDRVENYSQVLKQQKLKSMASTEGRKIAFTGFLPQILSHPYKTPASLTRIYLIHYRRFFCVS